MKGTRFDHGPSRDAPIRARCCIARCGRPERDHDDARERARASARKRDREVEGWQAGLGVVLDRAGEERSGPPKATDTSPAAPVETTQALQKRTRARGGIGGHLIQDDPGSPSVVTARDALPPTAELLRQGRRAQDDEQEHGTGDRGHDARQSAAKALDVKKPMRILGGQSAASVPYAASCDANTSRSGANRCAARRRRSRASVLSRFTRCRKRASREACGTSGSSASSSHGWR